MITDERLDEWLSMIELAQHPSIILRHGMDRGERWLQLKDEALPPEFNGGRKYRLSDHITRSEVVGTSFKGYIDWLEHEARESFLYRGVPIFVGHYNVDALVSIQQLPGALDVPLHEYRSQ